MTNVLVLVGYVAASSAGLLLLKFSLTSPLALTVLNAPLAGGAALYLLSFLLWLAVLAHWPLSVAYPVAIGLTLAVSALGSVLILGEPTGAAHLLGLALIFAGIVLLTAW